MGNKRPLGTIAPQYTENITIEEMEQIAEVNQIALNLLETEMLLNEDND